MKNFRYSLLFAAMAASVVCGCEQLGRDRKTAEETGQEEAESGQIQQKRHLYVSAVEFPDGYDWRASRDHSTENGTILLYRDGELVLSVQAGEEKEICCDPDMHHLLGGHIYSEFCNARETVIKRDGDEFIRYQGCETIKGMLSHGGAVYTLGQNKSGRGFSLRKDGELVLEDSDGYVLGDMYDYSFAPSGALYLDGDDICFAYYTTQENTYRDKRTWFFVENGECTKLQLDGDVTDVLDIKRIDGTIYFAACQNYHIAPVLFEGSKAHNFYDSSHALSKDYRIIRDGDEAIMAGTLKYTSGKSPDTGIWDRKGFRETLPGTGIMLYTDNGSLAYVQKTDNMVSAYSEGMDETVPERCQFLLSRNAVYSNGHFYLAVTPADKNSNPHLLTDGDCMDFKINGYLSSVELAY